MILLYRFLLDFKNRLCYNYFNLVKRGGLVLARHYRRMFNLISNMERRESNDTV